MMTKTTWILGATPVAALVLAGCSHTTREVVTPAPAVTTSAPPTVIVANSPPPAPQTEVRSPAPGSGYVWRDGYWSWRNGQYEWVPGYWESPRAGYSRTPRHWGPDGIGATPHGGPN
jgi:hypothetical protein